MKESKSFTALHKDSWKLQTSRMELFGTSKCSKNSLEQWIHNCIYTTKLRTVALKRNFIVYKL